MKHTNKATADSLFNAAISATSIEQFNVAEMREAYQIQQSTVKARLKREEKVVGFKLGFTNEERMRQMGVSEIISGHLTNHMQLADKGELDSARFIRPKVEPEIAFRLSKKITSAIEVSDVGNYIESVAMALEIVDSRYNNFKFSLEDVVADNCFACGFLVGDWKPKSTIIRNIDIDLKINGESRSEGNSNAILGNPIKSLALFSQLIEKYSLEVEEGAIIMAGAAAPAVSITRGMEIECSFGEHGALAFKVC